MISKIFLVIASFVLFSCASVERKKYYKASRFSDAKVTAIEDFNMSVDNHALITYAAGPLIPFIPVYLFEDMRRDIKENEELTIKYTRSRYLGPFKNHFEGIKINPPLVQIPEGKPLQPRETVVTNHEVKFIYPIRVLAAKEFIVFESVIIISNGNTIMMPGMRFKFINELRFKCCEDFAP